MINTQKLLEDIREHEGCKLHAYKDTVGVLTIGAGATYYPCDMTLMNRTVSAGDEVEEDDVITRQQADMMLEMHLDIAIDDVDRHLSWVDNLPDPAQEALYNMSFQLGISRLLKFSKMLQAVRHRRWGAAIWEGYDSKWRSQTPKRWEYVAKKFVEADGYLT